MKDIFQGIFGFDWDRGNWPKCGKHGVTREEIEQVFRLSPAVYPDPDHSHEEQRFLAIGPQAKERWVFIAFTIRRKDERKLIRPISARYMHDKEVQHHERQKRKGGADSHP